MAKDREGVNNFGKMEKYMMGIGLKINIMEKED